MFMYTVFTFLFVSCNGWNFAPNFNSHFSSWRSSNDAARNFLSKRHDTTLNAKKYDPESFIRVKVMKPLGISLEEVEAGKPCGVYVEEIDEGSIKNSLKVKRGSLLIQVNNIDVKSKDFDAVLETLSTSSQPLELVFIEPKDVLKGPALITIRSSNGDKTIKSLKGLNLRRVLLDNKVDIYGMKGSLTNCGGGGSCGTCVVNIKDNDDWNERPDFESLRLKKYDESARLSCNTIIEGDCLIEVQPTPLVKKI